MSESSENPGEIQDTYVAALQHDTADVPGDATLLGVMRRPPPWAYGQVDENRPELGPPADLLEEVKAEHERLKESGMDDAEAHNAALEAFDYDDRYWTHLEESTEAAEGIEYVRSLLENGETIVLVCFENTDEKRCHRTTLAVYLESIREV